jgi:uncharacterized protein (TIRG00374 family)
VTLAALAYVVTQITWHDRLRVDNGTILGRVQVTDDAGAVFLAEDGATWPIASLTDIIPGFWTLLRGLNPWVLLGVGLAYPVSIVLQALRWQWLLRTHQLDPGFRESLRLTWIGLLANNVLPGSTGGDLVKGWCIFRRAPGKQVAAVMTVFMDRVLGLVSLMLVGALALASQTTRPELERPSRFVWWCLLAVLIGGIVFFSGRIRRLLRVSEIVARLPFNRQIHTLDQSVFHYRRHIDVMARCVAISLLVHLWVIGCIYLLGRPLGIRSSLVNYYVFLPIIFTGSAFFPSIAGLGVMEGLFQQLFTLVDPHASSSAVALCILYRVIALLGSLPGLVPAYAEFSAHGMPKLVAGATGPPIATDADWTNGAQ